MYAIRSYYAHGRMTIQNWKTGTDEEFGHGINASKYQSLTSVSKAIATRDLSRLVKLGWPRPVACGVTDYSVMHGYPTFDFVITSYSIHYTKLYENSVQFVRSDKSPNTPNHTTPKGLS